MIIKALVSTFFVAALLVSATTARANTIQLVGFGDSLMAGYNLPAEEAVPARLEALLRAKGHDVTIANAGVSGNTTADGLARIDWSVPDGVKGVILELGANDALRGLSTEQTRANLEAMISSLKKRNIKILLAGMMAPPNMGEDYRKAFDAIFPELAAKHELAFYPFFLDGVVLDPALKLEDGMHPNGKGTQVMAERLVPVVEEFIKQIQASP